MRFSGKVVVIIGGNSGIGRASAVAFASEGAHVVITGRDQKTLDQVAAEVGPGTLAIRSDIADVASIDAAMHAVRERHGRIDVLFVNAGVGTFAHVPEVTPQLWDEVHAVNLRGSFFAAQKALPLMSRGGAIVFTGSIGSVLAVPGNVIYAATKAGLRAVARIFAAELVGKGIRVNMVSPGPTETPIINRNIGMDAAAVDALRQAMIANTPMRRMGEPQEIARAVLFLASDEASFITGVDLFVDGGVVSSRQSPADRLEPELQAFLDARLSQLQERAPQTWKLIASDARLQEQCRMVVLGSDFVQRSLIQDDQLLATLAGEGRLQRAMGLPEYKALLEALAARCVTDEAQFSAALRHLRRRELVRIAWRDISGMAHLHATLRETSWFAEAVIASATRFAEACLVKRHGALPAQDSGLVVLGMGKLGGGELNFSSDVDLVFLFPEGGTTRAGAGTSVPGTALAPLELEEFYTRQGRMLIRLLDAVTDAGFVFRVDMRLRPFGDSGPLVASFAFFEDYLQAHGRDWERYAYIKARALSGAEVFAAERESVLRPFVYRRYLDFGVFDALREMKGLISRDVARREMADNIKLGPGGIREVEFIVQAFQLVRGGQDSALREPSLLTVLPRLSGAKLLPAEPVAELGTAYDFLRLLENRTQMLADEQTHSLPADALSRERIAVSMGMESVAALEQALAQHRAIVARHFAALFADSEGNGRPARKLDLAPLWETGLGEAGLENGAMGQQLAELCDDAPALIGQLVALRDSGRMRRLDEPGRRRLKLLLELLIGEHGVGRNPEAWRRLLTVIEAIGQRSAYFSLLVENRKARERWVAICSQGDFLAAQLARNPALLDELIDERWVDTLPSRAELEEELQHRLSDVAPDDVEREVEALCRFKQAAVFRVALADLSGRLPLMAVSDRLTEIAELIVARTLDLAWRQMVAQLGAPCCVEPGSKRRQVRVAALGYGKLGGFELGYASDLDLVFLHDSTGEGQETDRSTPVDNQVFFLRFAQRLIHLLTMHSGAGRLYEVDVRLRPSGKGGLLVTSIEAFRRYQFEEAWTWEHQALLHARAVAGNGGLVARIESVRIDVLRNAVRRDDLREKVAEMRERMRRELSAAKPGEFDLKQDRGGIADIEFLAQYWALRWAREFPPLVHFSDTIRQLESVASAALVPQEQVDQLVRAYQVYRALSHRRSLEGLSGAVAAGDLVAEREAVAAIWGAWMSQPV